MDGARTIRRGHICWVKFLPNLKDCPASGLRYPSMGDVGCRLFFFSARLLLAIPLSPQWVALRLGGDIQFLQSPQTFRACLIDLERAA
jgi:hypothetical protein